ncbi:hypothetical protein PITCH_A890036 [uncultured Desulfobacterium sp.]|uniref:Uncharacterized protein n=1 Tax=uncultured Desulfobacterium sp. TaxID=201089 RepID=A0A445N3N3_9BACT|nr:hypothetical protein PITCH_A890036 [uncultured Desulfobacterium sp.]
MVVVQLFVRDAPAYRKQRFIDRGHLRAETRGFLFYKKASGNNPGPFLWS